MALGNGAPDIFSALAGIGQGRPELVFIINLTTLTMIILVFNIFHTKPCI